MSSSSLCSSARGTKAPVKARELTKQTRSQSESAAHIRAIVTLSSRSASSTLAPTCQGNYIWELFRSMFLLDIIISIIIYYECYDFIIIIATVFSSCP